MKTIVINRDKWVRAGANKGTSSLLNSQGNMCCLGFICEQEGVTKDYLHSVGMPQHVRITDVNGNMDIHSRVPSRLVELTGVSSSGKHYEASQLAESAANINDDSLTSDSQKERELKILFQDIYNLEFIGGFGE